MRLFIALLLALGARFASAQVNLDQPVPIGPTDLVFRSAVDATAVYMLPPTLAVLNVPRIAEIDGEYRAFFDVGLHQGQYDDVNAKVAALGLQLRMMHGWNALVDAGSSTDTPPKFKPRLQALGDAGSLGTTLPYMFAVRKIGPKLGKESQALLKQLFGSSTARHLGMITYEFNAVAGGAPYLARTSVGVFATALDMGDAKFEKMSVVQGSADTAPEIKREVIYDAERNCWDKLEIGQICLRK